MRTFLPGESNANVRCFQAIDVGLGLALAMTARPAFLIERRDRAEIGGIDGGGYLRYSSVLEWGRRPLPAWESQRKAGQSRPSWLRGSNAGARATRRPPWSFSRRRCCSSPRRATAAFVSR